ncbi:glycosyltransferase family 61 protein [Comamonas composti]|uniref:glycosyltransferase family 61 protein n=1 Tax=Comamonas composti TaxID=408558 RepID=UPI000A05154D|nr:glycosyltransferase 61 family protein [Comamonas composti]
MINAYSPIDLRKITLAHGGDASVTKYSSSEKTDFSIKSFNFYQDSDLKFSGLEDIFTAGYSTPEVYLSFLKNCTIGPRLTGFTRYWPMFYDSFYVWNFMSSAAKQSYEKNGIFKKINDTIYWDKDQFPSLKIPGLSVWFYPFGNLDHFLRECLPAIILLKEAGIDFSKINFVCSEISHNFSSFLIDIGIPAESIIITGNRWIECEEIIIPCFGSFGHLHTPSKYYIKALSEILERTKSNKSLFNYDKVYVSRRRAKMRRVLNEETIYSGLENRGFHIVDPGDYSIKDQINIFRNTSCVVGPHGMGVANYGFSLEGALLMEIMQSNCPRVSYFRTAQLKSGKYSAYWVNPIPLKFCLENDSFGDILIDSKNFFAALDEFQFIK